MATGSPRLRASVAASIDAPVEALEWIDEVFADMWSLGSSPGHIARWLAEAGVTNRATVLDLGCGKGAAAVRVAKSIGCRVVGVDAFGPFIERARALAHRRGVGGRCVFHVDGARPRRGGAGVWASARYDAAMMIGLFPLDEAAAVLRPLVRAGGVYLIDDCVDLEGDRRQDFAEPDGPLTRAEARDLLERARDRVIRGWVATPSQVRRTEASLLGRMERRIEAICARDPAARKPLRELLRRQRAAAGQLAGRYRPAMWLVRRGKAARSAGGRSRSGLG